MHKAILIAMALLITLTSTTRVNAKDRIKIGFLGTLSGQFALFGVDMLDGFSLFLKQHGNKLGDVPVDFITGDDAAQPNLGLQVAQKMVEQDHVDVIAGILFSPVLLSIAQEAFSHQVFIVSGQAAPTELAGKDCSPYFFNTAVQNDENAVPLGVLANKLGFKRVYVMGPDLISGRAPVAGFKREYTGSIVAEVYTPFQQLDYAAELAQLRLSKPDALVGMYGGGIAVNVYKQYAQSGLSKDVPFIGTYGMFGAAELNAIGDVAVGAYSAVDWDPSMKSAGNAQFVRDFSSTYHRPPSGAAAHTYDAAQLLDAAVRAVKGRIEDKAAFQHAMETVKFNSVRGDGFRLNSNHIPMVDWYGARIVKDSDGQLRFRLTDRILRLHQDAYVGQCKMPSI